MFLMSELKKHTWICTQVSQLRLQGESVGGAKDFYHNYFTSAHLWPPDQQWEALTTGQINANVDKLPPLAS